MIKLTGLWANKDRNGNLVLSGYLGSARLVIFTNTYKKEDKHPDYIAYVDEQKQKDAPAPSDTPTPAANSDSVPF